MAHITLSELDALAEDFDVVQRPQHYADNDIECIDAIRAQLTEDEWRGFLRGQVAKYNWRLGRKDSAEQDAGKMLWYATWLAGTDPRKER